MECRPDCHLSALSRIWRIRSWTKVGGTCGSFCPGSCTLPGAADPSSNEREGLTYIHKYRCDWLLWLPHARASGSVSFAKGTVFCGTKLSSKYGSGKSNP